MFFSRVVEALTKVLLNVGGTLMEMISIPVAMERAQIVNKDMKVEIPSESESMSNGGTKFTSGLQRQTSATKSNCLCSPTSHAGSFRCRLHRAPSLQRNKSIESASLRDSETKINTTADDTSNAKTIEAQ
ncbi:unnamed protein product [Dovyalis caffra]|uniref:Uncharacterized protein n=1 Tax=Dovyalis caffra TaxID=77055 RepID=A0AAV1RD02_9ROSI|nr:unnamed protein product [Dovyalis caffra]